MRTLMRTRKQLVRERGQHVQRIQKTLEDANLKIAAVVSDVTGTPVIQIVCAYPFAVEQSLMETTALLMNGAITHRPPLLRRKPQSMSHPVDSVFPI